MFIKKITIKYESALEEYPKSINPSKKYIPNWYKKIPKWQNNEIFSLKTLNFMPTVKVCVPFLEAMSTGYMITLPYDLYVKKDGEGIYLSWNQVSYPPILRDQPADNATIPAGHYPAEYAWSYPISHTIPKKHSVLITHPLNRHDLPFTTLSGVVDGGYVLAANGQLPFYIKQGFEGIIPQGTPIAQLIFFRNEFWTSKETKGINKIAEFQTKKARNLISDWYKKTIWKRKNYV